MSTGRKAFEFSVGSCGISSMEIDMSGKRYFFVNGNETVNNGHLMEQDCDWVSKWSAEGMELQQWTMPQDT